MLRIVIDDKEYVADQAHDAVLVLSLLSNCGQSVEREYSLSICSIKENPDSENREISIWADSRFSTKFKLMIESTDDNLSEATDALPLKITEHKKTGERSILQYNTENVGPIRSIEDILNHRGS